MLPGPWYHWVLILNFAEDRWIRIGPEHKLTSCWHGKGVLEEFGHIWNPLPPAPDAALRGHHYVEHPSHAIIPNIKTQSLIQLREMLVGFVVLIVNAVPPCVTVDWSISIEREYLNCELLSAGALQTSFLSLFSCYSNCLVKSRPHFFWDPRMSFAVLSKVQCRGNVPCHRSYDLALAYFANDVHVLLSSCPNV